MEDHLLEEDFWEEWDGLLGDDDESFYEQEYIEEYYEYTFDEIPF